MVVSRTSIQLVPFGLHTLFLIEISVTDIYNLAHFVTITQLTV